MLDLDMHTLSLLPNKSHPIESGNMLGYVPFDP